jgi:RecA/RadA recombinase
MRLGEGRIAPVTGISTGCMSLDFALGGAGVPRGRVAEIFGPESSGKTTLTLHTYRIGAAGSRVGRMVARAGRRTSACPDQVTPPVGWPRPRRRAKMPGRSSVPGRRAATRLG